jgi:uncharacterized protein YifE (UPF0438 family)
MNKFKPFTANSKFYALEHFPYGLKRCGEFTKDQALLLEAHGACYDALDTGVLEPRCEEEQHFLDVCQGKKEAVTIHEKVWRKFCKKTQEPRIYQMSDISKGSSTRYREEEIAMDFDD